MQMRMMPQRLAPGMQHCQEADLGAEVFRIGSNRAQRLGCGGKENVVDDSLILQCQRSQLLRQRKHDMEVLHRQEVCQARLEPAGFG